MRIDGDAPVEERRSERRVHGSVARGPVSRTRCHHAVADRRRSGSVGGSALRPNRAGAAHRRSGAAPSIGAARRRRALVGVVLAAFIGCAFVVVHDVLAGSSGLPASAASSRSAPHAGVVTALPGDSLWAIAEQYRGDVPVDRYVDQLVRLNGGPSIVAGQTVLLP